MHRHDTRRRLVVVTALGIGTLTAALAAGAGCSHTSPYVAPDLVFDARVTGGRPEITVDTDALATRVLLIGDAGAPADDEPVLVTLRGWASEVPALTTVVFLGDNIYDLGLADPDTDPDEYADGMRRLVPQLDVVTGSGARGIFIPGNHDWGHGGLEGLRGLARQEQAVTDALGPDAFLPRGGCAGPVAVDLDGVRLVVFDSQWFFQKTPASPCAETEAAIADEMERLVSSAGERAVFVLGHHPMASHGPHGGFFDWKDHVFPLTRLASWAYVPLPVVGSLYPLVRGTLDPSGQDLGHRRYREFVEVIAGAVDGHRPLLYASGHEHVLQVLEGDGAFRHVLVTGAGSAYKVTAVGHGDDTRFAHAHAGFMCLDVLTDGRVALRVVEPGAGVVFSDWLGDGGPS